MNTFEIRQEQQSFKIKIISFLHLFAVYIVLFSQSVASGVYCNGHNHRCSSQPCRRVLFTGCGYSGTGFLSKLFTSAGYPVGHECMDRLGISDWRRSFEDDFHRYFDNIYVQVRHPLSVVNSCLGTGWKFTIASRWNCSKHIGRLTFNLTDDYLPTFQRLNISDYSPVQDTWGQLTLQLRCLEWWIASNVRALAHHTCWWRVEEFGRESAIKICNYSELPHCSTRPWDALISKHAGHNRHRRNDTETRWDDICPSNGSNPMSSVCQRARAMCSHLGYSDC